MKAVVAAFNQEKALVGAFWVITNLWMDLLDSLVCVELQMCLGAAYLHLLIAGQRTPTLPGFIATELWEP